MLKTNRANKITSIHHCDESELESHLASMVITCEKYEEKNGKYTVYISAEISF
ncbi:MAG: hypothetical protein HUK15_07870 [Bacteroidales bacterium]|nr:hypothetical protein [Bacteroidales bacterium]